MKNILKITAVVVLLAAMAGCGETIGGVGKDASRIWYGTKTIFVSQN